MEEVRGTTMNVNKTSGQLYNNVTYFLVMSEKKLNLLICIQLFFAFILHVAMYIPM